MHGLSIRAPTCNCGKGLRRNDTLQQRPGAKVIRSVFVHLIRTNFLLRPFWITSVLADDPLGGAVRTSISTGIFICPNGAANIRRTARGGDVDLRSCLFAGG
jgi:hypothetical protein